MDRKAAPSLAGSTRVLLIRHAEAQTASSTEGMRLIGVTDVHLTAVGHEQAARLGRALGERERWVATLTSPLVRARATAEGLRPAGGGQPVVVEALREIDCGLCDGLPVSRVQAEQPALWEANLRQEDDDFCWPGGESYRELRERSLRVFQTIVREYRGQTVAVVSHAGVISQIVGAQRGTRAAQWELHRPGNTGVTELLYDASGIVIARFDDRSHLTPELGGSRPPPPPR